MKSSDVKTSSSRYTTNKSEESRYKNKTKDKKKMF